MTMKSVNKKQKWIVSKREFEVDSNGQRILKKVTKEYQDPKREVFDRSLKIIGGVAIFFPILLFYLQQRKEADSRKTQIKVEAYTNMNLYAKQMLHKEINSNEFNVAYDKFNEQISKVVFIDDQPIIRKVDTMQIQIDYMIFINEISQLADSTNDSFINLYFNIDNPAQKKKFLYPYLKNLGKFATKINSMNSLLSTDKILNSPSSRVLNYTFSYLRDSIWKPNQTRIDKGEEDAFINSMNSRLKHLTELNNQIRLQLLAQNSELYSMMIKSAKF
jgi:hypothetical protein